MNDRYLFKAKRKNWKEIPKEEWWVVGYYFCMRHNDDRTHTHHFLIPLDMDLSKNRAIVDIQVEIDPSTLCQCTSLKDKVGNLIWENDVVKCIDRNSDSEFYAVVKFGNPNGFYSWGYQLKHIKGDEPNLDILLWVDMEETGATIEVIGNSFDNPELLI